MERKSNKAQNTREFREKLEAAMRMSVSSEVDVEQLLGMNLSDEEKSKEYSYMDLMVLRLVKQACAGHDKSIQEVLDRLLGKPTQVNENLNITATYEDFLDKCIEQDSIDAEYTEALPSGDAVDEDFFNEIGI